MVEGAWTRKKLGCGTGAALWTIGDGGSAGVAGSGAPAANVQALQVVWVWWTKGCTASVVRAMPSTNTNARLTSRRRRIISCSRFVAGRRVTREGDASTRYLALVAVTMP